VSAAGCAHFVETRTIELFSRALENQDLESLRQYTSERFEQKALRSPKAIDTLQVLNLPEGKPNVLSVEEVGPDKKDVVVEIGETKRKLKFRLQRDPKTKKWVVDDIFMRQHRPGMTVTEPVSEQMDLLLSVQEFFDAWSNGDRQRVLSVVTPELADLLQRLPPDFLARVAKTVTRGTERTRTRPRAEMQDTRAYVRIQSASGPLEATFVQTEGTWKLDDLSLRGSSDSETIRSLRELARIVSTSLQFLDAYRRSDKSTLAELTTETFFRECLQPAELSLVELPGPDLSADQFRTILNGHRVEFVIDQPDQRVTLSLVATDPEAEPQKAAYRVEDATIYELDGTQEKRLSALLTAHAVFHLFAEALVGRDLKSLQLTSTADFNDRVWKRLDPETFREIPLPEIENVPPKVLSTVFQGPVTEITVIQGSRALTYRLLDDRGRVLVDDVVLPVFSRPTSLKTTLELLLPIRYFAQGFVQNDLDLLQQWSSRNLNRLVWLQTNAVPSIGWPVASHLEAPLTRVEFDQDQVRAYLGDDRWGAVVFLEKTDQGYRVDDVQLIAGTSPDKRVFLKQAMRLELAGRMSRLLSNRGAQVETRVDSAAPSEVPPQHEPPPVGTLSDNTNSAGAPSTQPQAAASQFPSDAAQSQTARPADAWPFLDQAVPQRKFTPNSQPQTSAPAAPGTTLGSATPWPDH